MVMIVMVLNGLGMVDFMGFKGSEVMYMSKYVGYIDMIIK